MTLIACLASPGVASGDDEDSSAVGWGKFKVGSAVIRIEPTGGRPMDVLLLYPADKTAYESAQPTLYTSRLNGVPLDPSRWDPMSFTVAAEGARHDVPIDQGGPAFPLIIYSHPNSSDPQNQAPTLERLASHGYVIAAPWHEGDTQDDQIIDTINQLAGRKILQCLDGGPDPCLDPMPKALQNRALDIAALLDEIPGLQRFRDRVDMERVGLLGQSRGSLTALAAAAGSTNPSIAAEPRIKAIMMLAIGARPFVTPMNLAGITVPSLFITSKGDRNAGDRVQMNVSVEAFRETGKGLPDSTSKGLVILERAEHAAYSSNRCAQMQATGAILEAERRAMGEERIFRAIGEQLMFENIMGASFGKRLVSAAAGTPIDFCRFDSFVNPVDILELAHELIVKLVPAFEVTNSSVPRQLDTATAMGVVVELANSFFGSALVKHDQDDADAHFKQYLAPEFLLKKEGAVVSYAETQTSRGREVACDDPELRFLDHSCP